MSIREIPKSYVHACQCCGVEEIRSDASRIQKWCLLTFEQTFVGYADERITKLLCPDCGERTLKAIERVEPRAMKPEGL
jgi:hypothetical protein